MKRSYSIGDVVKTKIGYGKVISVPSPMCPVFGQHLIVLVSQCPLHVSCLNILSSDLDDEDGDDSEDSDEKVVNHAD